MLKLPTFAENNDENQQKEEQEAAKKLLRLCSELSRRLDECCQRACAVAELFNHDCCFVRLKLRDATDKLMQTDPLRSGIRAIDYYWRKGIYETIARAKQLKKGIQWSSSEKAYVQSHILNGKGHFHHLMFLLEEYDDGGGGGGGMSAAAETRGGGGGGGGGGGMSAAAETRGGGDHLDFSFKRTYGNSILPSTPKRAIRCDRDNLRRWVKLALHKCLMYLGDLARYMPEFRPSRGSLFCLGVSVARRHYHAALTLSPADGRPFNQLAALAGDDSHGLDAAHYYLRCLICEQPFEGAESNLAKLLDKNRLIFNQIDVEEEDLNILKPAEELRRCVVYALQMLHSILFVESDKKLAKYCQRALKSIENCLHAPDEEADDTNGDGVKATVIIIDKDMSTKLVAVVLLAMELLRKRTKTDTALSMGRAFLLALFTHLITRLLSDLGFKLFGPEALVELFQTKAEEETKLDEMSKKDDEIKNMKKSKKSGLDRFRRRVAKNGGRSSGEDSDLSENGESSAGSEEDEDESDEGEEVDHREALASDSDDDDDDVVVEEVTDVLSVEDLTAAVAEHVLIQPARLASLWLMTSSELVKSASGSNSQILWDRLAKLFNIMSFDNAKYQPSEKIALVVDRCKLTVGQTPFPEDLVMRGVQIFKERQRNLVWDNFETLSTEQKGVSRIFHFNEFRGWLCSLPESHLAFDAESRTTRTVTPAAAAAAAGGAIGNGTDDRTAAAEHLHNGGGADESPPTKIKKAMMQNMAQLWLQQEVTDLERKTSSSRMNSGLVQYSPYVVVDHLALTRHLNAVKGLVASRKFAVIIPLAVVHELDNMKKSHGGARNAIRWLEKKFLEGNRWLRAQKKSETRPLELIQPPRRKNKEAWTWWKIIECCHHFSCLRGGGKAADSLAASKDKSVTLLTADRDKNSDHDGGNATDISTSGLAEAISVRVENVDEFSRRTKICSKPNGNSTEASSFRADIVQPSHTSNG